MTPWMSDPPYTAQSAQEFVDRLEYVHGDPAFASPTPEQGAEQVERSTITRPWQPFLTEELASHEASLRSAPSGEIEKALREALAIAENEADVCDTRRDREDEARSSLTWAACAATARLIASRIRALSAHPAQEASPAEDIVEEAIRVLEPFVQALNECEQATEAGADGSNWPVSPTYFQAARDFLARLRASGG